MFNNFADYYDAFAYDIPYNEFYKYIKKIFQKNKVNPKLVLDICCGTGTLTSLLAQDYEMIGVDASVEMLNAAKKKDKANKILYLNQSMTDFELYGTVDAAISTLDSVNYILTNDELKTHFMLMHNYLNNGGYYIFDISTLYKFKNILGGNSFIDEVDDTMFIWQNSFDANVRINTMYLDVFVKNGEHYDRISETHFEAAYTVTDIKKIVVKCGFEIVGIYDNLSFTPPKSTSERIFFVIKKN